MKMVNILKRTLKNNELTLMMYDQLKAFYFKYMITDEKLVKKRFKQRLGREVNLKSPATFADKQQWLKLNWYDPLATKCADKYEVREIIKEKIGEEYLNEIIAIYESVNEIDIDKLPDKFVLKGTHGSGFNIICKDKSKMNWDEEFKKMSSQFDEEKVLSGEFINHYQDLNPDFWLVYYQAGKYYFNQKDYQKAKIEFEKALKKEITTVPDKENVEKYLKRALRKLK